MPVLIPIASQASGQPVDRGVGMANRDEHPRDVVGVGAGELPAGPLRSHGIAETSANPSKRVLEYLTMVAAGTNRAA